MFAFLKATEPYYYCFKSQRFKARSTLSYLMETLTTRSLIMVNKYKNEQAL